MIRNWATDSDKIPSGFFLAPDSSTRLNSWEDRSLKIYNNVEFCHRKSVISNGKMKLGVCQVKKLVIFDRKSLNLFLW